MTAVSCDKCGQSVELDKAFTKPAPALSGVPKIYLCIDCKIIDVVLSRVDVNRHHNLVSEGWPDPDDE